MSGNTEKVHFISLGCPKNLVDTEIMYGSLSDKGYEMTQNAEEASVVVVNSCGFIEDSKAESISTALKMTELKSSTNIKKVILAGCLTQRYKKDLVRDLPEVDIFVGSGDFQNIAEIIDKSFKGDPTKEYFDRPTYLQELSTPRVNSQYKHRAYLKISEGCKKRCSFCAIPNIRGNLQSRTVDAIVGEAKLLVAGGVKELIVISHDFTDYGWDLRKKDATSVDSPNKLLERLAKESGADWIRVLYLYPDGINDELISLMKAHKNILPYFDMPLQHINNEVLKKMNRRMTRQEIEESISKVRMSLPDAIIRTQFIVGFPGETQEQFDELVDFVKANRFDRVGAFKYSKEEDTKAGEMENQIAEDIKQERFDIIMSLQNEISAEEQESHVGKTYSVLVDAYHEETELLVQGRYFGQAPDIDGVVIISDGLKDYQQGEFVNVKITEAHDYDLVGEVI